jgi:anti-sigma regulatory factor (Ser/Thr protein kinase)
MTDPDKRGVIPVATDAVVRALQSETYPVTRGQVAHARRMAAYVIGDHPKRDDAILLVSELATNVVRHSGARHFTLSIFKEADGDLTITVTDNGNADTTPHLCKPRPDNDVSGRGIRLVDQLAKRWGITRERTTGLAVWFVLDGRPADSSDAHAFPPFEIGDQPCPA